MMTLNIKRLFLIAQSKQEWRGIVERAVIRKKRKRQDMLELIKMVKKI